MSRIHLRRRDVLRGAVRSLALIPAAALIGCNSRPQCNDVSQLTPEEAKLRTDQNYLEAGADRTRFCEVCQQWEAPPEENACGGCKVMKGPINPKGTCNLFVKQA